LSNSVAPLPTGPGITAIAEHRPRRDPDPRHPADEPHAEGHEGPEDGGTRSRRPSPAPPPAEDEEVVPAETLFAAALLANALPRPVSPDELRLRTAPGWTPPESALRLRDKLI
jgi:hypothetical protein